MPFLFFFSLLGAICPTGAAVSPAHLSALLRRSLLTTSFECRPDSRFATLSTKITLESRFQDRGMMLNLRYTLTAQRCTTITIHTRHVQGDGEPTDARKKKHGTASSRYASSHFSFQKLEREIDGARAREREKGGTHAHRHTHISTTTAVGCTAPKHRAAPDESYRERVTGAKEGIAGGCWCALARL